MGFSGSSFLVTEGIPWPLVEDTASWAGCNSQMVKVPSAGGSSCDQGPGQVQEQQQGGPGQGRFHHGC